VPTIIAVGVASPRAQGQAMIRTAMKFIRARAKDGCGPKTSQTIKVVVAIAITTGTNIEAI
jgi:hypothetical protein